MYKWCTYIVQLLDALNTFSYVYMHVNKQVENLFMASYKVAIHFHQQFITAIDKLL